VLIGEVEEQYGRQTCLMEANKDKREDEDEGSKKWEEKEEKERTVANLRFN
jgi:hypothetical protein